MTFLDPRLWGALLLASAIGVCGGYWKGHHDADQSATVDALTKERNALKSDNDLYRQTTKTLAGISDDAKKKADQARADARAADTAADGLRKRVAELVAAAKHATTAGGSPSADGGTDALDLLAGLFSRTDEAAGEIARFADAAHISGLACERSYDALTGKDTHGDQSSEKDR